MAWAAAGSPYITSSGAKLDGATVASPFTADLADAGAVTGDVTWLLDDKFAGRDATAPYQWTVTTTAGAHKLKARWVTDTGTGQTAETVANFTVGTAAPVPFLSTDGLKLDGANVASPFTAVISDAQVVSGEVTWLLDDSFAGKDSTAPYEWAVSTTPGAHKLKARWVSNATTGATSEITANFTVTETPYLTSDGFRLHGTSVKSPFTADLSNADAVTGEVTWLLDDKFAGKDASAPYQWTVNTTDGSHKLKARWVTNATTGATAETTAVFTVNMGADWTQPEPVYEEPGPALKRLWTTADNRRKPVDGLYDWSKAGFGGGTILPTDDNVRPEDKCRITAAEIQADFGVVPNDDKDDTAGLQKAIDHIKAECSPDGDYTKSSRILLPAGTLNINRELSLDADYLILRGAGSGAKGTRLVYRPNADTRYDTITKDGTRWDQDAMKSGDAEGGWIWPGRGMFRVQSRAVADKYKDQYAAAPANRKDLFEGTVNDHWTNGLTLRGKPGDANYAARKGDKTVYLASDASFDNLKVGGLVNVMAANSQKFYEQMKAVPTEWDLQNLHMRQQVFMVTEGDPLGKTITLDKPLEYDLPLNSTSDGSAAIDGQVFDSKVTPLVDAVVGVGIENLSFTQDMPNLDREKAANNYGNMDPSAAMHGIVFKWAANSWVKGVRAEMTGSHPIVTEVASNLSVVDNYLEGSWNKGKGGNGYFRGSRVWDSLYAGNTTRNLRHFTFQWSASGNVAIGNSFDSDLNLHGGYERNNLFELNEVSTPYAHRSAACATNCGDEGGSDPDDSDWYPIWWAAGKKAVKWSGSSGPNNVFHNNHLRKQLGDDTQPYADYAAYKDRKKIYRFGSDGADFHHLDQGGTPIADWAHNEEKDYTGGHGVDDSKSDSRRSIFLESISLTGYGGPHPQPLRRTWGCSCWDGKGMVNTRLAADPVNTATGTLTENFTDLSLAGPGSALSWERTYNSLDPIDGPLGQGWTFGYNAAVTRDGDSYTFRNGTGGQTLFKKNANGTYTAEDPGVSATMEDRSGGGWRLTNLAGDQLDFDDAGRLVKDVNDQGHGVTLTYSGGALSKVTDTLGQTMTVTWGSSGADAGHITTVTASDGHSVGYGYTNTAGKDRLTSVTGVDGKTTRYTYDGATGYLNSITDPEGNASAKTKYDPETGRVIEQTDALGGVWKFGWDAASETATITDPAGTVTQDIYQGNVLVSQIDADGRASDVYYDSDNHVIAENSAGQELTRNEYDDRGNLTKRYLLTTANDDDPSFETWTYDDANRVTSHTDALDATTRFDYDSKGRLETTTYPDDSTTKLTYTDLGQVETSTDQLLRTTRFAYSDAGDLVKTTSPAGAVTTFTYDASHNKLSETSPRGNVEGASEAEKEKYTTHWTYDDFGNVLTETDPLDRTTHHTYDALSQLKSTTAPDDGVTSYEYDGQGNLTKETAPGNRVTRYEYDDAGRETAVIGPDGAKTTSTYDPVTGQLISTTAPEGNVDGVDTETRRRHTTTYTYDAEGRQTQTRLVDPNAPNRYLATSTTYDAQGRVETVTGPDGSVTRTGYDSLGRVTKTTDPTGAVSATTYDVLGRVKTQTASGTTVTSTYDSAGQLKSTTTAGGAVTSYTYDQDGRLKTVTDPRGNAEGADPADYTTTYTYDRDGNRTDITNPLGDTVHTDYDPAGQPTKVTDADGHSTDYRHDDVGNVDQVTTATDAVTKYDYDTLGQLKSVTTPKNTTYSYTYDAAGRIKTTTTPEGRTTSYTYTPGGRPDTVTLPDEGTAPLGKRSLDDQWNSPALAASGNIHYRYDTLGRTTAIEYSDEITPDLAYSYDKAGLPSEVSNGTTTAKFAYDPAGRVTKISRGSDEFVYDWDTHGRLKKRTLPGGRTQAYTYNDDARQATATLHGGSLSTDTTLTYSYDPAGQLKTTTRTGGPTTSRSYDAAGRLTRLTHALGGKTLTEQTAAWNNSGTPARITTTRGTTTSTALYTYDDAGAVTGICLPASGTECTATSPTTSYTYDDNGNRTETRTANTGHDKTTTYTYDLDDRAKTETTGGATTTFAYDANGSLASQTSPAGTRDFTYRLDGNLADVTLEDGRSVSYTYDESGNRTRRAVNGTTDATWTWDTLDGLAVRLDEKNTAGETTHQWWADPAGNLGTATLDTATADDPLWLLGDYQGTITDTADKNGLTGSAAFDPFGEALATATGTFADNPLRFHGQYLDTVTGLYDVRARDYDSGSGRFTSPDPQPASAGTPFANTYHYGYNSPTVLTDPTGQCAILCGAIVGGVIGGIVGGIDYAFNGGSFWGKVGTGALVGAAVGAGAGWIAGAGWGAGAAIVGGAALEGAGNLAYNWGTSTIDGRSYGVRDGVRDFAIGAGVGGVLGVAAHLARPYISPAIAQARAWIARNKPGAKPKDLSTVKCVEPNRTVYRVEGAGNERVRIQDDGSILIRGVGNNKKKGKMLFLSFGDHKRTMEFLAQRLDEGFHDSKVKSFEVRREFFEWLEENAVPESMSKQFPDRPLHVDTTKTQESYGLRPEHIKKMFEYIVPKSGRVSG
ncbi:RHS repeat-associated core domain-containing protein [Streptomyces odonnellii]|uniref:RHS repeat-associated core domain-containing protein n=1 Tax=Streptomyces odonnellii TaxID=1417980 RepID=UPI00062616BB|nr:RHS repeat-associated core domain-containing protein [Streptomyces odonnellii]